MAWLRSSRFAATSIREYRVSFGAGRRSYRGRRRQRWQNFISSPSHWWDGELGKRIPGQRGFGIPGPLWVNSEYKPARVDIHVGQSGMGGSQWSLWGGNTMPAAEFRSLCEEGQLDTALNVLLLLDQQGENPGVGMYRSFLKACCNKKALTQAKRVQAHLAERGLEASRALGEQIVITLVKCGGLRDAVRLFQRLPLRTTFSWTALISGYAMSGQGREALLLYIRMQEEGVQPNTYTFVSLLKACNRIADLAHIHAEALKYGCGADLYVQTCLVDMYGKCGSVVDARKVFDEAPNRSVVLWNVMLAAYVQVGQAEQALQFYEQMQEESVSSDARTFVTALQACGIVSEKQLSVVVDRQSCKVKSLVRGKVMHAHARTRGYDSNVFVSNTLVSMYGKCGSSTDSQNVFERLAERNVVSWNAVLVVHAEQGEAEKAFQVYEEMREEGVSPTDRTFVSAFQACSMLAQGEKAVLVDGQHIKAQSLNTGKVLHVDAWRKGYTLDVFIGSILISMYGKCGSIAEAQHVFEGLCQHDVVLWTAMLMVYVENDDAERALQLYAQMQEEGPSSDVCTFVSALRACSMLAQKEKGNVNMNGWCIKANSVEKGKAVHADAWRKGYHENTFICSALISMYTKCGSMVDAQNVFDGLSHRDLLLWNAMLVAYAELAQEDKALELYGQMQSEGVSPDVCTFLRVVQACGGLAEKEETIVVEGHPTRIKSLERGREIHAEVLTKGYESSLFLGSALVSMYGKCGSFADAWSVFDSMPQHDVVSWNVVLMACIECGRWEKALQLYRQMQQDGVSPDDVTLVFILQACSSTGGLALLGHIHDSVSTASGMGPFLASALISAYGRCARMADARRVFDALPQPDAVSWNALISGYARQGNWMSSLQCYDQMQLVGMKPDGATFLSLLSVCSHAGLVDKGVDCLESMIRDHGIPPQIDHYVSMVDLFGRAGCFRRVDDLLSTMPMQPNLSLWLSLMGACQKHGKVALAEQAFSCAVHLEPRNAAAYVLMSNIYDEAGLVDHAKQVKRLRQKERAWKKPGQTWIGHGQEVHTFLVGDSNHVQHEQVYELLGERFLHTSV